LEEKIQKIEHVIGTHSTRRIPIMSPFDDHHAFIKPKKFENF